MTSLKKSIPLALFERFVCERELETERNCNILTSTLMAISVGSFSFSRAPQPEAWWPSLLGNGFLYHILSPTGLQKLTGCPEGPFCRVVVFSTTSLSNSSVLQLTDFLLSPSNIIVKLPTQYLIL